MYLVVCKQEFPLVTSPVTQATGWWIVLTWGMAPVLVVLHVFFVIRSIMRLYVISVLLAQLTGSVDDIGYRFHVNDELEKRYSLINGTEATDPEFKRLRRRPRSGSRHLQVETRLHWNETPVGRTTEEWTGALRTMDTSICCPGPLVVSLFQTFRVA